MSKCIRQRDHMNIESQFQKLLELKRLKEVEKEKEQKWLEKIKATGKVD